MTFDQNAPKCRRNRFEILAANLPNWRFWEIDSVIGTIGQTVKARNIWGFEFLSFRSMTHISEKRQKRPFWQRTEIKQQRQQLRPGISGSGSGFRVSGRVFGFWDKFRVSGRVSGSTNFRVRVRVRVFNYVGFLKPDFCLLFSVSTKSFQFFFCLRFIIFLIFISISFLNAIALYDEGRVADIWN